MKHGHRFAMGALVAIVLVVAPALIAPTREDSLAAGDTIYVDVDATGANNGSSWEDAFTDLQPALGAAVAGDEIWVATGIYTPTRESAPGDPRSATFQLINGVALYGGFDPSVSDIGFGDRDWVSNVAILSGDLNGDDGPGFANNGENSYHVFYHPDGMGLDQTAVLDGFTISGGNANASFPHSKGGGMYNYHSSPTLTNCTFAGNSTGEWGQGGGMYNEYAYSLTLTNCTFLDNSASEGGGMLSASSYPLTLTNCTFSGNSARSYGGGMVDANSSAMLTNCTFSGNSTGESGQGGGMYVFWSVPKLINCTFSDNSANEGGGMYNYDYSFPALTNCTFSGNSAGYSGGAMYNDYDSSPKLSNCVLWGDVPNEIWNYNASFTTVTYSNVQGGHEGEGNIDVDPLYVDAANGNLHIGPDSPCIDRGNNDHLPSDPLDLDKDGNTAEMLPVDLGGNLRIVSGLVDMGAYEQQTTKEASLSIAYGGDPVSYMVAVQNVGANSAGFHITDTLPMYLTYIPDSLQATSGSYAHTSGVITWTGLVDPEEVITLTFGVTVGHTVCGVVTNTAVISSSGELVTRSAVIHVRHKLYLPIVAKGA